VKIKRKIIHVRFVQSRYNKYGHGSRVYEIECGHEIRTKASVAIPRSALKFCRDCKNLRGEAVVTRGNQRETWDAEQQWPKREEIR
jgi:ribosome-binding protein aMBF1 (putative translation factor)